MGSLYLCTSEGKKLVFYIYTAPGTLNKICLIHTFNIHQRRKKRERRTKFKYVNFIHIYIHRALFALLLLLAAVDVAAILPFSVRSFFSTFFDLLFGLTFLRKYKIKPKIYSHAAPKRSKSDFLNEILM